MRKHACRVWYSSRAYDDYIGVAGVYDTTGTTLAAAVKVWGDGDTNRMANLYLPEGMERFPADRADGEGEGDEDAKAQ